jgi:hypothetical protein
LVWKKSDRSKIRSADTTLTAAPLPSPPKSVLRNKVIRETIAKNPHLFKITTPINVDRFEKLLKNHPNQPFVKSVVRGLRNGFWPYADTCAPNFSTTFDNSRRPIRNPEKAKFIRDQRDAEIKAGRWSKAFKSKLLPGMRASPISATPKSSGGYRLIIDQSSGRNSLNSMIQPRQVIPKLDNIHDLGSRLIAVRKKHPKRKLDVFKSDVTEAYRLIPMHPFWQVKQAVTIDGKHHIDRCNTFGNRASGWVWDSFMSLVRWVGTEKKGIKDLHGYVDDDFSWEFKDNKRLYKPYGKHFPAKQARYLELWDELGIPHKEKKQLYGRSLPIIGYDVDPNAMKVKVPEEKKTRLVGSIREFAHEGRTYTLSQLQSMAGSASSVLSLYPHLRPHLRSLFDEMAGKTGSGSKLQVTEPVARDLNKLADYLERAKAVPIQTV